MTRTDGGDIFRPPENARVANLPAAIAAMPADAEMALASMLRLPVSVAYVADLIPPRMQRDDPGEVEEVRRMRQGSWDVTIVSLRDAQRLAFDDFDDLRHGRLVVHDGHPLRQLGAMSREWGFHPWRSVKTMLRSKLDAVMPGEPTRISVRLGLIARAMRGIQLAADLRRRGVRHLHCRNPGDSSTIGMYAARQLGVGFSFDGEPVGETPLPSPSTVLLKRKLRRAAFVVCQNTEQRECYRRIDPADNWVYGLADIETRDTRTGEVGLEQMLEMAVGHGRTGAARSQTSNAERASSRRYALITPCRDEAKYARRTLDSVTQQSIPPAVWVIVDDGSTDQTPQILAEYAERFPYIKVITRADRGERKLGGGVIDAFYAGYESISPEDYDYVCKLDLDLDLPPRYFETLMQRMEENPRIGTCSGKPYFVQNGRSISEKCGDEASVGMIKFYRTECFTQIGGFVRELMWDGIDCHRCRMRGWIAVSWDDPAINFEHLRPMGTSHKNWWTGRVRHGVGQYFMGTGPAYMGVSAVYRMSRPPLVVGGLAMLWGYLRSAVTRKTKYEDREFRRFLRRYQWSCLFLGKSRATERLNRRQSIAWQSNAEKGD
jgi:glycosyltransferase involved in cell wall biosynthesis